MRKIACFVVVMIALCALPQGLASWAEDDVKEVPCFDFVPAPASELAMIKNHGEGWWHYLQGNRAHARISSIVLTGKPPAEATITSACIKVSRHDKGFKQTGFGGMAEFKCEEMDGKRMCKPDPDSKSTMPEWAAQRGMTDSTTVWTHGGMYAIALRCSGTGASATTVWSLRSTEAKDPPQEIKDMVKEVVMKLGFKAENILDYPCNGCPVSGMGAYGLKTADAAQSGRSIATASKPEDDKTQGAGYAGAEQKDVMQAGRSISAAGAQEMKAEAADKQGAGYAAADMKEVKSAGRSIATESKQETMGEEKQAGRSVATESKQETMGEEKQGGRSIASASKPGSWAEEDVKEVACFDYVSAPASELAMIKNHGDGWWHYLQGNRAHARVSSIVLTGKPPAEATLTSACIKMSRHDKGFKQTGFGGMAEFKCEEMDGKRMCKPDPDSKGTMAEWAAQRGMTDSTTVWTHGDKYAIALRCSGTGAGATTVWSLRSTEAKDPPQEIKDMVKEVVMKLGFKAENILDYPCNGCPVSGAGAYGLKTAEAAQSGRSIAGEDKTQGAEQKDVMQAGRSIAAAGAQEMKGEAEDKQGAGYAAADMKGANQAGRSIATESKQETMGEEKQAGRSIPTESKQETMGEEKQAGRSVGATQEMKGEAEAKQGAGYAAADINGANQAGRSIATESKQETMGEEKQAGRSIATESRQETMGEEKQAGRSVGAAQEMKGEAEAKQGAGYAAADMKGANQAGRSIATESKQETMGEEKQAGRSIATESKQETMGEEKQAGRSVGATQEMKGEAEAKQGAGYAAADINGANQAGRSIATESKQETMGEEKQAGRSIATESRQETMGEEKQAGRSIATESKPGSWAEEDVKEVACFDYVSAPASELAMLESSRDGWWHYLQGNRAHARISSIVLTGKPPAEGTLTSACIKIWRHDKGFRQTGFGGMAEFKCETMDGKRMCKPDPESKGTMAEWAAQRGMTDSTTVWTHGDKYALALRCSGTGAGATTVWSLRSNEPKDPPQEIKDMVKGVVMKLGFKAENILDYPCNGCSVSGAGAYGIKTAEAAQSGRSITAEEKTQGAEQKEVMQAGRSIVPEMKAEEEKQGTGYAAAMEHKEVKPPAGRSIAGDVMEMSDTQKAAGRSMGSDMKAGGEERQGAGYAAMGSDMSAAKQGGRSIGSSMAAEGAMDQQGAGYSAGKSETQQAGRSLGGMLSKMEAEEKQGAGYTG